MNLTFTGRKCSIPEAFEAHCEKKLAKVQRLLGEEHADTKITATAQKQGITVEVTVRCHGLVLRAEEGAQKINDALDHCVDVLVRQIRKNKTRLAKKIHMGNFDALLQSDPPEAEELEFALVRTKTVPCKPSTLEEAILQMNLIGHEFFLFLDAETNTHQVVYRRTDGTYGVLQPETNS